MPDLIIYGVWDELTCRGEKEAILWIPTGGTENGVVRGKGFEPSNSYETRRLPSRASGRVAREVLNLAPLTKLSHPRTGPVW